MKTIIKQILQCGLNRSTDASKVSYFLQVVYNGTYSELLEAAEKSKGYYAVDLKSSVDMLCRHTEWSVASNVNRCELVLECGKELGMLSSTGFSNLHYLMGLGMPKLFTSFEDKFRGVIVKDYTLLNTVILECTRKNFDGNDMEQIYFWCGDKTTIYSSLEECVFNVLSPQHSTVMYTLWLGDVDKRKL